jgi:hypothetical protein
MNSMQCLYTKELREQATTMLISGPLRTESGINLMTDQSRRQLPIQLSVPLESAMVRPQAIF